MTKKPKSKKSKKQPRRIRPFLTISLLLAALAFFFFIKAFLIMTAKPTISVDYVKKINNLNRPANYNPAEDAALLLKEAETLFVNMPAEPSNTIRMRRAGSIPLWPEDLGHENIAELRSWIKANQPFSKLIDLACQKSYVFTKSQLLDGSDVEFARTFPDMSFYYAQKLLIWQFKLDVYDGNFDKALAHLQTLERLTALLNSSGDLSPIIALDLAETTASLYLWALGYSQEFAKLNPKLDLPAASLEKMFEREHLMAQNLIQHVYTDDGKGNGLIIPPQFLRIYGYTAPEFDGSRNLWDATCDYARDAADHAKINWEVYTKCKSRAATTADTERTYTQIIPHLLTTTPAQLHADNSQMLNEIDTMAKDNIIFAESIRPHDFYISEKWQTQARIAAAKTVSAILAYQQANNALPATLQDLLNEGFLKELPTDPYSDKPLVYEILYGNEDFVLYSIAGDFNDDHGKHDPDWAKNKSGDYQLWPIDRPKIKRMLAPGLFPPGMTPPSMISPTQSSSN